MVAAHKDLHPLRGLLSEVYPATCRQSCKLQKEACGTEELAELAGRAKLKLGVLQVLCTCRAAAAVKPPLIRSPPPRVGYGSDSAANCMASAICAEAEAQAKSLCVSVWAKGISGLAPVQPALQVCTAGSRAATRLEQSLWAAALARAEQSVSTLVCDSSRHSRQATVGSRVLDGLRLLVLLLLLLGRAGAMVTINAPCRARERRRAVATTRGQSEGASLRAQKSCPHHPADLDLGWAEARREHKVQPDCWTCLPPFPRSAATASQLQRPTWPPPAVQAAWQAPWRWP